MIARRYIWPGYAGLLCLVAGLCFGNLRTHLLDTHDAETFRDHLRIQQDWTLFFSPDKEQASGRPTAEAVKYLVFLLCGNDPGAFHLLSIAIHTLAALLLARVVFCLGNSAILAGLTGLLFLVNVTHFQAIHHISALDYPLALCCGLAALLMLGRGTTPKRSAAFAALLALGVLAHPSIAVVWTLAGYLLWRRSDLTAALGALWPSGLVLAAAFFATLQLAADNTSTWQAVDEYGAQSAVDLVLGMLRVLWWFCSRLLTTAHWLPLPIYVRQTWELALGAALCALLLWLVWRSKEPLAAAALATLLGLMPYLLLTEATILGLPAGPSRYLYLASAGSSLLLAWLFDQLRRRIHGYLAAALLVGLLASSYHALRQVEAVSFYTSARSYSASKEYDAAREQFRRALAHERAVIPTADAYVRFCLLLMDSGEDHIPLLAEALAAHPENRQLRLYQLATAATDTAAAFRERAMQLAMDQRYTAASDGEIIAKALHNLGAGFRRKKEPARAILAYQQALRIAPDRFKTLKDLTFAHWQLAAQWAERIDAENPAPQTELVARFRRQIDAAISTGQRALGLRPDADLYYQLGKIYQQLGQRPEALAAYRQTLAQNPDYARAYQRMAEIYTQQGDQDAAARALQTASTRPNANPPSPQPDR